MNDWTYIVDGARMSSFEMFQYAVHKYGRKVFMITDSKAVSVLRQNGHTVVRQDSWKPIRN